MFKNVNDTISGMEIRNPAQLLDIYNAATKENPLELRLGEHENFIKAMRMSQAESDYRLNPLKIAIVDRDVLLKDGVRSTVDNKMYSNRMKWNDHLKRHGCVEIGNDYNNKTPRPSNSDHNVRADLINVMKQKGVL